MIIPCTCSFSNNFNMLLVIARNSDWFITLFTSVVIGLSNSLGTDFATIIWKPFHVNFSATVLLKCKLTVSTWSSKLNSHVAKVTTFKFRNARIKIEDQESRIKNQQMRSSGIFMSLIELVIHLSKKEQ